MEATKESMKRDLNSNANAAAQKATNAIRSLTDDVETKYHEVEDQVKTFAKTSLSTVKKYPLYSMLGAVGVGVLIGLVARRGK